MFFFWTVGLVVGLVAEVLKFTGRFQVQIASKLGEEEQSRNANEIWYQKLTTLLE